MQDKQKMEFHWSDGKPVVIRSKESPTPAKSVPWYKETVQRFPRIWSATKSLSTVGGAIAFFMLLFEFFGWL